MRYCDIPENTASAYTAQKGVRPFSPRQPTHNNTGNSDSEQLEKGEKMKNE